MVTNSSYYRHPRRDDVLVTAAGPFANLGLAFLAALLGGLASRFDGRVVELAMLVIQINVFSSRFLILSRFRRSMGATSCGISSVLKEESSSQAGAVEFFYFSRIDVFAAGESSACFCDGRNRLAVCFPA